MKIYKAKQLPKEYNYSNGTPMFAIVCEENSNNQDEKKSTIIMDNFSSFEDAKRYLRKNYNKVCT